jgi:membrane protease YdiL (CAAX protease family)
MLWAHLLSLPPSLGALWLAARARYPAWKPALAGRGSFAGKVWLAVLAWLVLAPIVLAFNAAVNAVFRQLDLAPEQHSLTALGGRPLLDRVLFVLEACVGAALREEVIFRGVLLAWCVGRLRIPGGGGGAALDRAGAVVEPRATPARAAVSPFTAARPWFVMAAALGFAVLSDKLPAVVFAVLLLIGLGVLWRFKRTGARRARAVYATAALFAVVHSGVWPSPIPLFLLGLGLGWLAVRTNGVLVPVIVHGLFNAVSAVFVLRA